jgi:plasmid stability protein
MSQLLIPDVDPAMLTQLQQRAAQHGRTLEDEARTILERAAEAPSPSAWTEVDAIRQQLAASGRQFSDSAELVREDRDR